MNSLVQLEIPKRNTHCFLKGERLVPGMEIYSQLLEREAEGVVRNDFCLACWNLVQVEEKKRTLHCYWKSQIEHKKPSIASSRMDRALALLKEWQQVSELREAEIFVLCLFLARARQLILRQEFQKEGTSYYLYEIVRREEYLTVKALHLSHLQIETIQKSLASHLSYLCNAI